MNSALLTHIQKAWDNHVCHPDMGNIPRGSTLFFERNDAIRYTEQHHIKEMLENLTVQGKTFLEVGVGVGADAALVAKKGAIFFGMDLTRNAVFLSKERFRQSQLPGSFIKANAEIMPFKNESFDVVYSMGVLHHTPDTETAIQEIYRILKSNGNAIIMLYYKNVCTYYLKLLLWRGILKGLLLRKSKIDIMNELEFSGCPLTKLYSKKEAKKMFKHFSAMRLNVKYLSRHGVPVMGRYIPQRFFDFFSPWFGFHLIIFAKK